MPICETLTIADASAGAQVPRWDQVEVSGPAIPITPTGSPFTYQNTNGDDGCVLISGGTVTSISWSRDGVTFFLVGLLAGMVTMNMNDFVRVVYVAAPTMTFIPF